MIRFGMGTAFASLVVVGGLTISSSAFAQGNAYAQGTTKDPAACASSCQNERASCLAQMGTPEMCGVDYRLCTKQCEVR